MTIELGILLAILSGAISYAAFRRNSNKDIQQEAALISELRTDIRYIKKGVDEIKNDLSSQENKIGDLTQRVAIVEASAKSAHKRIDKIEKESA